MNRTAVPIYPLVIAVIVFAATFGLPIRGQSASLIVAGAAWRYLDGGADPGPGWRTLAFDDSSWALGQAELGFGDGDERTTLSLTNAVGATNITYYFRHAFTVDNLTAISNLLVRIRRDDGAIVYLNDREVFRSNMPPGPVSASTLALTTASDDGASFFANSVNPAFLLPGPNVLAVELHQRAPSSTDVSFDLELVSNVQFQPPNVSIVSPGSDVTIGSLHLAIAADASDTDGTIALVEFFQGGTMIGGAMSPPFSVTWSNIAGGSHTLRAVAFDSTGLAATSAPVTISVPLRLVPSGGTWTYLDAGAEPGLGWAGIGFNDAAWGSGAAPLGFGDGDEATLLSRTNSVGETNITYYFRHAFDVSVSDLGTISNAVLRVQRDDGCRVFLNAVEVFRNNLPSGALTFSTLAVTAIDDDRYHSSRLNAALFVPGRNVIAVEVHQAALTSSDVRIDLELLPNQPTAPPSISITSPADGSRFLNPATVNVTTATDDYDDRITAVGFFLNGVSVGTDTTDPFTLSMSNLTTGTYTLMAVATDQLGQQTPSVTVGFQVVLPPVSVSLVSPGSVWRFSDAGIDLGTAWRAPAFDDASWLVGAGKLGFADNPVTLINIGPMGDRYLTAYFRHQFSATNAVDVTNLAFRVVRDDGCVAYLNGVELFRMNMPAGEITYLSRALTAVGGTNENYYYAISVAPPFGALRDGANVLALELHQSDPNSSDAGFDLGLVAVSPAPGTTSRLFATQSGADVEISWRGTGFLQSASEVAGPYADISPAVSTSPYVVPPASERRFFRIRQP